MLEDAIFGVLEFINSIICFWLLFIAYSVVTIGFFAVLFLVGKMVLTWLGVI